MVDFSIFNDIALGIFLLTFLLISVTFIFEVRKKHIPKRKPLISFMIPSYNNGKSLSRTIQSVFDSYDKKRLELFVINDASKDNTNQILKNLSKVYPFTIITNKENLGKAKSINDNVKLTKGEIIWILDSDTLINKKVINEGIARLENPKVGVVSCRHVPISDSLFSMLQGVEYGMYAMTDTSHNLISKVTLWGACLGIKSDIFKKVGFFSYDYLTEDQDLALKVVETGYKVEEIVSPVFTYVPTTVSSWYKQKIRWAGGGMQNLIRHFKCFIQNPITLLFIITNTVILFSFVLALVNNLLFIKNLFILFEGFRDEGYSIITSVGLARVGNGLYLIKMLLTYLLYPLFSIPYVAISYSLKKNPLRVLLIFPYVIIYLPILVIISILGIIKGAYLSATLSKKDRAWVN